MDRGHVGVCLRRVTATKLRPQAECVMSVDAFESAVLRGDAAEVAEHLESGADPNGLVGPLTVLMAAAEFPRVEVVKLLLDAGADVNAVAEDGRTALLNAIWSADSSPAVVAALVEAGADLTVTDSEYRLTPEEWARKCGKVVEAGLVSRST